MTCASPGRALVHRPLHSSAFVGDARSRPTSDDHAKSELRHLGASRYAVQLVGVRPSDEPPSTRPVAMFDRMEVWFRVDPALHLLRGAHRIGCEIACDEMISTLI